MEAAFGETLVQFKAQSEEVIEEYKALCEQKMAAGEECPPNPCHEVVQTSSIDRSQYVAVLFCANYCSNVCEKFYEPFGTFMQEMNKMAKRMQVIVVNCDKREKDYTECISKLPAGLYCIPFKNQEVMVQLEDLAQAASIPKVAVFDAGNGFDKFVTKDIKATILKNQSPEQAVTDVITSLL